MAHGTDQVIGATYDAGRLMRLGGAPVSGPKAADPAVVVEQGVQGGGGRERGARGDRADQNRGTVGTGADIPGHRAPLGGVAATMQSSA